MVMGIADRAGKGLEFMVATESDLPTGISPLGRVGIPVGISESLRNLPFSSFIMLLLDLLTGTSPELITELSLNISGLSPPDLPSGISLVGTSSSLAGRLGLPVGILDCEASAFFPDVRFAFDKVLSL
jgi:hypothetical protein